MAHTQNPPAPKARSINVLICEDDPVFRAILERVLIGEGHRVCWASTARGALDLLRTERDIGLVLVDWKLDGDRTGLDVALEVARRVPCFMLSGYTQEDMREHAQKSLEGITLFFSKGALNMVRDLLLSVRSVANRP
jgi:CheY-like chemotaxis protein